MRQLTSVAQIEQLLRARRYREAIDLCKRAAFTAPNNAQILFFLGLSCFHIGDVSGSVSAYSKAIALGLKSSGILLNRGIAHVHLRDFASALGDFNAALRLDRNNVLASCYAGISLFELKRFEEALAYFDKAIALRPAFAQALYNKARALAQLERPDEALLLFLEAAAQEPQNPECYNNIGLCYRTLADLSAAIANYDKAIALKSDYAEAWSNRGTALMEMGDLKGAVTCYERAIALRPDFLDALSNLAKLPKGLVPAERAAELLRQWRLPDDSALEAKALFLKADLLRHLGQFGESFNVFASANALRRRESAGKIEVWREENRKIIEDVKTWRPRPSRADSADTKLLLVLGPSRSGKTTVELAMPQIKTIRKGLEGRSASPAVGALRDLHREQGGHAADEGSDMSERVLGHLFYGQKGAEGEARDRLITNTNPFLIGAAHLIFDLCPASFFVFVFRDAVDNAADIFATDYRNQTQFAYDAQTAVEYVTWYHAVANELIGKMGARALKMNYSHFIANREAGIKSIAALVGMDFQAAAQPADFSDPGEAGVYRGLFVGQLEKGIDLTDG